MYSISIRVFYLNTFISIDVYIFFILYGEDINKSYPEKSLSKLTLLFLPLNFKLKFESKLNERFSGFL